MESQSARFEREAEEACRQLSATLEELRSRMTAGRVVDQVIDYTRGSPAAEFLRNLGREVRENPMPLIVVGIGILWLLLATNRTSRAVIASAADQMTAKAEDIGAATSAAMTRTSEWGQQMAARLSDRASDVASTVGNTAAELTDRARDAAGGLADKARSASTGVETTFDRSASSVTYQADAYADERR
jgi:ElaB/YqjD/DUF883 family membrane-anchored ribosome-binding protein